MYPKLAKKCKTDMLLPRRMQLKLAEERSIMTKNTIASKPVPEVNILMIYNLNFKMKEELPLFFHSIFTIM